MTLDYYRIFYYVAKYKSFSKAARMLDNNQPNITRCMNILESELDCKLLNRSHKGITLTPEGNTLYSHVSIAMKQLEDAENAIIKSKSLSGGTICIGVSDKQLCNKALHLEELQEYPFISLVEGTGTHDHYTKFFYDNDLHFNLDMEASTTDQVLAMVQSNLGLGFYPEQLASEYIMRGEIFPVSLHESVPERDTLKT